MLALSWWDPAKLLPLDCKAFGHPRDGFVWARHSTKSLGFFRVHGTGACTLLVRSGKTVAVEPFRLLGSLTNGQRCNSDMFCSPFPQGHDSYENLKCKLSRKYVAFLSGDMCLFLGK